METMTHGGGLEWGLPANSSREMSFGPLKIGPFLVGGREPIHDLPLIEVNRREVYLTFPEGVALAENEVFRVVRPLRRRDDPILASGQPRRIVADVKIVRVMGTTRALVWVLRGSATKGIGAERVRGESTG
jgi:hypothetical protein